MSDEFDSETSSYGPNVTIVPYRWVRAGDKEDRTAMVQCVYDKNWRMIDVLVFCDTGWESILELVGEDCLAETQLKRLASEAIMSPSSRLNVILT